MNEEKFQEAISAYADSLGSCRQPAAHAPVRRARYALAVAGVVAVAAGTFLLWPRSAVGATLNRVGAAISNATTMEVASSAKSGSGKWREYLHKYYKRGAWAYETRKGSGLENRVVVRDGWMLTEYRKLDHATLEKADPEFFELPKDDVSALEYVEQAIVQGQVDIQHSVSVESSSPVNGRPAYKVVLIRPVDGYRAEILVDKTTNLPISSNTQLTHGRLGTLLYREEYRFDHRIPDSLFSLTSEKPVLRLATEQAKLAERWRKPMAEVAGTQIRDVSISSTGTIWVACTTTLSEGSNTLPTEIEGGTGLQYTRTLDIIPSSILGKEKRFEMDGKSVVVVGFIPLSIQQPQPNRIKVVLATRAAHYPGFSDRESQPETIVGSATLNVRNSGDADRPNYFPALDLDHFGFQLPIVIWEARAKALEKADRTLEAAKAYEQTAVAYRNFVKYVGYRPLLEAARCYRSLGMTERADALVDEAHLLETGRER